jgi:GT2 family glycosyltransferase
VNERLSAVVPTVGRSPWLVECLEALRRQGPGLEIVLVDQAESPVEVPPHLAERVLRPGKNLGFAGGANLGIAEASGEFIAVVNDDAVVDDGWLDRLAEALAADPRTAAVQGLNVRLDDPSVVDGAGIGWNRWWQAVQLGHGEPVKEESGSREIFGVSATAALYRREALLTVTSQGEVFDSRLGSYYEDVDLAVRLRSAGWRSYLVPAARARHAGSVSGAGLGRERLVYGNRHLVLARHLGPGYWPRLPLLLLRDLGDLLRHPRRAPAILSGWGRAARRLPGFARRS